MVAFSAHLLPHLEVILTGKHRPLPKQCRKGAGGGQEARVRFSMGKQELFINKAATPNPTPSFQYSKLWSWEMVINNLDKTTTKCSPEKPFLENLTRSTGIVLESKD